MSQPRGRDRAGRHAASESGRDAEGSRKSRALKAGIIKNLLELRDGASSASGRQVTASRGVGGARATSNSREALRQAESAEETEEQREARRAARRERKRERQAVQARQAELAKERRERAEERVAMAESHLGAIARRLAENEAEQRRLSALGDSGANGPFLQALIQQHGVLGMQHRLAERELVRFREALAASPVGKLHWKVLPPGGWRRFTDGANQAVQARSTVERHAPERLVLLDSLKPKQWYVGSHLGESVYVVAEFDHVAIADTPNVGNALYYCRAEGGRWQRVFRLNKQEALQAGAGRIIHNEGWELRVRRLVERGLA